MDAHQETVSNPFGMDEDCRNCSELCETRRQVVHGYGDVGADFAVIGTAPSASADGTGLPLATADERSVYDLLARVGLCEGAETDRPDLTGVYCTTLTRCRHPDREPTDDEIRNCEAFLTAEIRMINPEILIPVGERALSTLVAEYTTDPPDAFALPADQATRIRGRGFELFPTMRPSEMTASQADAFVDAFLDLLASDYRQTKGRRGR